MDSQGGEMVYGTPDDSHVMSERVQSLASSIYQEFERMMKKYDEDVVKELMPLTVGILEGLDQSYQEKQENDVEVELLRDDNEQLLTQYEREKQLRKTSDQKILELEDRSEEDRKDLQGKVESLESIVRMFELKAKNAQDHVSRLEDKDNDMKKEYSKLHERYTELFRTHMDYMERTKLLMGSDKLIDAGISPRGRGFQLPILKPAGGNALYGQPETPVKLSSSPPSFSITSPSSGGPDSNRTLKHELRDLEKGEAEEKLNIKESKDMKNKSIDIGTKTETAEKEQVTDSIQMKECSTGTKQSVITSSPDQSQIEPTPDKLIEHVPSETVTDPPPTCDNINKDSTSPKINIVPDVQTKSHQFLESVLGKYEKPMDKSERRSPTNYTASPSLIVMPPMTVVQDDSPFDSYTGSYSGDMMQSPELEEMEDGHFQQVAQASPLPIVGASKSGNESSLYDELSFQDNDGMGDMEDMGDMTGMSKEVENLILENTELLATKNALNVVKDDLIAKLDDLSSEQEILREEITSLQVVKDKMKKRVSELEEDLKKSREDLENEKKKKSGENPDEEQQDEVPMAQRKRFTRVEMARVLMERNQYKERLMELQEAVRWTEMIRASREHPDLAPSSKKKGSIWNFFSNLFGPSDKPPKAKRPGSATSSVKYSAPTTNVRPVGDPNKQQRDKYNLGEKAKAYDFLQDDVVTEKARREREKERREQYKQVRAHVKKDDGRMQAYGWSLPAKFQMPTHKESSSKTHVPVPVPVYCRPLLEKDDGMKLWCAAGVNLTGGRTKDGGSVVGASIFYATAVTGADAPKSKDEVEKLDQELKAHEQGLKALENETLSSLVWVCNTMQNSSQVTVVDANNPGEILDTFHVTSSHILCIASVPGAMEEDYQTAGEDILLDSPEPGAGDKSDAVSTCSVNSSASDGAESAGIGGVTFVQCATGATAGEGEEEAGTSASQMDAGSADDMAASGGEDTGAPGAPKGKSETAGAGGAAEGEEPPPDELDDNITITKATGSPAASANTTPTHQGVLASRRLQGASELVKDGLNILASTAAEKMTSVQPTMWLGCQSGSLYVHSAVSQWRRCLHSVKLKDSVLSIVHVKGHAFVAMADGSVAVFHRNHDLQWDLTNYHLVTLGSPQHSIRCMCVVVNKHLWCGYRNKIHVMDPKTLKLEKSFDAHPRKESQVRQLAWVGDGVWVSIRLDSTLRLYHAFTHQHLQDVDIEPYVSKMLGTGKLGFSFVRITSLLISCSRLWIGTGNGVIISVPLSENNKQSVMMSTAGRPGGVIRVYSDNRTDSVTPGSFIPYCSMAQAQLSFHGHRDAVKFFVAVPGAASKGVSGVVSSKESKTDGDKSQDSTKKKTMLVLSGGEGYIDFRIGDTEEDPDSEAAEEKKSLSKGEKSHLIVWHLSGQW